MLCIFFVTFYRVFQFRRESLWTEVVVEESLNRLIDRDTIENTYHPGPTSILISHPTFRRNLLIEPYIRVSQDMFL